MGVLDISGFTYSDWNSISLDTSYQATELGSCEGGKPMSVGLRKIFSWEGKCPLFYDHFIDSGQRKTLFMVRKQDINNLNIKYKHIYYVSWGFETHW